jgi:hypothetical protein
MAAVSLPVTAQTTGSPYEPELQQIVLEGKVDPANLKPLEPGLASLVADGSLEIRFRIDSWAFKSRTYRMSFFVVTAGSPLPTPGPQLPDPTSSSMIVQANIRAETIFHHRYDTGPMIAFAGRVAMSLGGIGQTNPGEVWMIGFSYPNEAFNPAGAPQAAFQQVSVLSPGQINAYIQAATGSITVALPHN